MSEAQSSKVIIAESIIENFEAISSYVVKQSLRDMVDENQALRDELDVYRAAVQFTIVSHRRKGLPHMAREVSKQPCRNPLDRAIERVRARAQAEQKFVWTKPWYVVVWRLMLGIPAIIVHGLAVACWSVVFCKRISLHRSWKGDL